VICLKRIRVTILFNQNYFSRRLLKLANRNQAKGLSLKMRSILINELNIRFEIIKNMIQARKYRTYFKKHFLLLFRMGEKNLVMTMKWYDHEQVLILWRLLSCSLTYNSPKYFGWNSAYEKLKGFFPLKYAILSFGKCLNN